jgi:hypothetical protein
MQVFFQSGASNKVIIQVSEHEWKVTKKVIHQPLECLSGVYKAKRHEKILKQTKRCDDRRFGDVDWVHGYLMVPFDQVNDREVPAPVEACGEVHDGR